MAIEKIDRVFRTAEVPTEDTTITPFAEVNEIIFVIDESVNLRVFESFWLKNDWGRSSWYFPAFSYANCSAPSNYYLRYNVADPVESQRARAGLSLLEKAKRVGYTTIYYDLQNIWDDHAVHNYFQPSEYSSVDIRLRSPEGESYPDLWAMRDIETRVRTGRNFILINKQGSHFPYQSRTLPKDRLPGESAYKASIRINTITFLRGLRDLSESRKDVVVFYTSDHGENLELGKVPHCGTTSPPRVEFEVPIVFMGTKLEAKVSKASAGRMYGHADLTEALNNLLGYRNNVAESIVNSASAPNIKGHGHAVAYGTPFPLFRQTVKSTSF